MTNETIHQISPEALAVLGGGKLAYVKTIRSEDVQKHFPQAPELAAAEIRRLGDEIAGAKWRGEVRGAHQLRISSDGAGVR